MERIKLLEKEGYWLTNGEVFGKVVYVGINDKPENWREISDAEYREIEKAEGFEYDE